MSLPALPTEILHKIVDSNGLEAKFLLNCSLVHSVFRDQCQKNLFSAPAFSIDVEWDGVSMSHPSRYLESNHLDPRLSVNEEYTEGDLSSLKLCHALGRFQESLKGFNGKLPSYIHSLSITIQLLNPLSPLAGTVDSWKALGTDVLRPITALVHTLPSLQSLYLFNNLPIMPIATFPDINPVLKSIISGTLSTLQIRRFVGRIPPHICSQLERLHLEDARISLPRNPPGLTTIIIPKLYDFSSISQYIHTNLVNFMTSHTSSTGHSSVPSHPNIFPNIKHFRLYAWHNNDLMVASQVLTDCKDLQSLRMPLTSNYFAESNPPMNLNGFAFPDRLRCLAFDIDIFGRHVYVMLAKRIQQVVNALGNWSFKDVRELELKCRFQRYSIKPSDPHFEGDFSQELRIGWRRLKEAIYLRFAGNPLTVKLTFEVYGCRPDDDDNASWGDKLYADRSSTVSYLERVFAPLKEHQISTEIEYGLIQDHFSRINQYYR